MTGARSVLLRLVAVEVDGVTTVLLDRDRVLPGRGVWLHPDQDCLRAAIRRSSVPRGLRLTGAVDLSGVGAQVTALAEGAAPERYEQE